MCRTRRKTAKPAPAKKHVEDRRLVVEAAPPGEDTRITEVDVAHPHYRQQLQRGEIRLFDAATDSRGPAVPFIATWGKEAKTWHPLTQGVYVVAWKDGVPTAARIGLNMGMGNCTAPQFTRAAIASVYADILRRRPDFAPLVEVRKVPCVMCADAPDAPGGSRVVIDAGALPAPADANKLHRWYA